MRIGIHVSSQGDLEKTARKASELGANTFQIFSSSPRSWRARQIPIEEVERFLQARQQLDLQPFVIHVNYLVNLASPRPDILEKSIASFRSELERALLLKADYLVVHPGSTLGDSPARAIQRVAESIARAAEGLHVDHLAILLEHTAGQGSSLGSRFEELAEIREKTQRLVSFPVAFCLDTAHLIAAGYDITTPQGFQQVVEQIHKILGIDRIPVIHANDSKTPPGSRIDRHEHIGEGYIGNEGFKRLLNHPQLQTKAFILETPFESEDHDRKNIERLKSLCRRKSTITCQSN